MGTLERTLCPTLGNWLAKVSVLKGWFYRPSKCGPLTLKRYKEVPLSKKVKGEAINYHPNLMTKVENNPHWQSSKKNVG